MARHRSKFGMATASIVGLVAAGAMAPVHAGDLKSKNDDCPQAAVGALKTIASAQTDYNHKSRPKKKAAKKKAMRKKAAKKAVKRPSAKLSGKRALKRPVKKAKKKAAKRRVARRNPC